MISVFTFSLLAIIAGMAYYWYSERKRKLSVFANCGIPGPKPHFIYGNYGELYRSGRLPIDVMADWLKRYGDVIGYYKGTEPFVLIKDLDLVSQALIREFRNFPDRPSFPVTMRPISDSIVAAKGAKWKKIRSITSPLFTTAKLRSGVPLMNRCIDVLIKLIKAKKDEPVEISGLLQGLTLDVIEQYALAIKGNPQENPDDMFRDAVAILLKNTNILILAIAVYFPRVVSFLKFIAPKVAIAPSMLSKVLENVEKIIAYRKKNRHEKHSDFLQLVLDASTEDGSKKLNLTDEEVLGSVWTFLIAGYDTTSSTLTYATYLLALHPECQQKLYEEVTKGIEGEITSENVAKLSYLEQVISETLRVYPTTALFVVREAAVDVKLGQYNIKAGTNIQIPVYQIHHDPDLWPNPSKYDPERFSPENSEGRHPMSYLPFGHGPRNCIGKRFAELQMKVTLARLIRIFRFETCDKTDIPLPIMIPNATLAPAKPIWIRAIQR